jgi:hypothetical protein
MRALALIVLGCTWLCPLPAAAADCTPPRTRVSTILGLALCIDPAFEPAIAAHVEKIRSDVSAQRQAGKLVLYLSTPVGPRDGGRERIDLDVAKAVKVRLERELGDRVWVLDPHQYALPPLEGRAPGPEEQMLVWTRMLAGTDGLGRDVDLAYFTGPTDVRAYFGCARGDLVGCLARWIAARMAGEEAFRMEVEADPGGQAALLRYYAVRASSAQSKTAHDEWNVFVRINRRRPLEEQIGMFFDGRALSPAEVETPVWPGYELR